METYLLKFSACLFVFWLVYVLLLERQKMHQLKRFYLLGSVILALVIPLLTITYYIEPIVPDFEVAQTFIPIEPIYEVMEEVTPPFWNLEKILWLIYGIGVLVFFGRFVINLFKMFKRIAGHEKVLERSFIYVLLEELRIPHSFFKYIFFNQSKYQTNAIPKEVILHEETHAKQLHSIDIIIIELLQIVFWFHPLVYILKHHIKLNHEFLADQAVLQEGIDTKTYQNILLQFSSNTDEYQLSSAINYSSIKKRFTVMKTQTSKTKIWISSLLLLPIITILYYSFAEKEYVEKDNTDLVQQIKDELDEADKLEMIYVEEASEKLMQEYRDFIETVEKTKLIRGNKYERAYTIYYDLMSNEQRASVKPLPKVPNINLTDINTKRPPVSEFNSWKDPSEYALWLNGESIPNSKLNNLSVTDIVYYSGSFVHKNARSNKFPQSYQYHLYTKVGFEKTYIESDIKKYNALTKQYSIALNNYLQGLKIESSDLQILKARLDRLYKSFTKEELKKHDILSAQPIPSENKEQVKAYIKKIKNMKP
ncbi:M56 family metallopeptidase [Winogradskyella sp. PG-2]|uniref:M56 family metallopeptidase n=1 Tax=Winogradskyella sp. PG-2 TaxID=754409 RepID=UPI00045882C0|nr:M56 family metallopeptidase [Winogradskyella sp. PG-2]BAO75989.1 regulatory sensor-transducer, BlaR1/MecR1 family / TonB-dependent receptor [Winogradskyella sp. PG-2]